MKRYFFVITLLALLIMASGCISENQTNQTNQPQIPSKTYSANGMFFQYPDTWNLTENSTANTTQIIIILSPDAQIINDTATKGNFVSIKKEAIPQGINITTSDITDTISSSLKQFGLNSTNETINISGVTTTKFSFNQTVQNATDNVWVIAFEKTNFIYSLTFVSALENNQTANQNFNMIINRTEDTLITEQNFNMIINSFKVE